MVRICYAGNLRELRGAEARGTAVVGVPEASPVDGGWNLPAPGSAEAAVQMLIWLKGGNVYSLLESDTRAGKTF